MAYGYGDTNVRRGLVFSVGDHGHIIVGVLICLLPSLEIEATAETLPVLEKSSKDIGNRALKMDVSPAQSRVQSGAINAIRIPHAFLILLQLLYNDLQIRPSMFSWQRCFTRIGVPCQSSTASFMKSFAKCRSPRLYRLYLSSVSDFWYRHLLHCGQRYAYTFLRI